MNADLPQAPRKEKVRKGHYVTSDGDGTNFDIKQNAKYGDWDVRDDDGILHAREASLGDALNEVAAMFRE